MALFATFWLTLGTAVVFAAASAAPSRTSRASVNSRSELVWPAPPEVPRIGYLHSIQTPADLGIKRSGLARFGQWLSGSGKSSERLRRPFGLGLDESGNLLITDTAANVVFLWNRAGRKWYRYDKAGQQRLISPVAAGKAGNTIYVADSALQAVLAMDQDGKLLFSITNHLERPSGLALSGHSLYVADSLRHCVVTFDLEGNFVRDIGERGVEPGRFNFPTHVAADNQGRLYVTDSLNARVQVLDSNGAPVCVLGTRGDNPGEFGRPKGVAVDTWGRVYIVDALSDNVQIFSSSGQLLLRFGSKGSNAGEFWLPSGIAINQQNEIYVADTYNSRVQIFRYVGPP